ncbi:MAG: hypothetical protein JST20_11635 [Bacteroidetes bacterium]|nr:hypothetical protein [Bacteroidota bacterium]
MIKNVVKTFVLFVIVSSAKLSAQSGMTFADFAQKLDPYFDKELIMDISAQLPQGSEYRIWSWDVGDFSGDGFNDVAFAVKVSGEKRKIMTVYLVTDIDGYLTTVAQFQYNYVDLPLEVGVVIKENACYTTHKLEEFNWVVRGYKYETGSVVLLDEFVTAKVDKYTRETYKNYQSLQTSERFVTTSSNETSFFTKYLSIPCYPRGRQMYRGYTAEAVSKSVENVTSGAFYWGGENDCSFSVRSVYDQDYLYMTIAVTDDELVTGRCDSCTADFVDIWFDTNQPGRDGERFVTKTKRTTKLSVRSATDSGIYCITAKLGDFLERKPYIKVKTTDELDASQKSTVSQIKVAASPRKGGYIVKLRIPFLLLGYERAPVDEKELTQLGCTVVVHDSDNEFRPEEETQICTSSFSSLNPATYGTLLMIPQDKWYGETTNLYSDSLLKYLGDMGF